MKLEKLLLIGMLSQLSVACLATPYVPTKLQHEKKGVAPPRSSPTDDVQTLNCAYKFTKQQSLEEISITAAQMQQDCGLTTQQVLILAQKEFETK